MKSIRIPVTLLVLLILAAVSNADIASYLSQGFESFEAGPLDGQKGWSLVYGDRGDVVVQSDHVSHGKQAVELKKTSGRETIRQRVAASASAGCSFTFDINTAGATSKSGYVRFNVRTDKYQFPVTFTFEPNGTIKNDDTDLHGRYNPGKWNHVVLLVRSKDKTFDLSINGVKTDSNVPWLKVDSETIGYGEFDVRDAANPTYIDNFQILPAPREIPVDLSHVKKNISHSVLGAASYDFSQMDVPVSFQYLVTDGREKFAQWCKQTGIGVFRLATLGRWSVRGEAATREIMARTSADWLHRDYHPRDPKKAARIYKSRINNTKRSTWFDPDAFYSFCKDNGIKIISMIDTKAYYDVNTKKAVWFANEPEHYDAAAREGAYYVKWVKDHGYQDQVVAWEIGNETYYFWKPEEYAAYARKVIAAVRKVNPDIKLAVSLYTRRQNDPDAAWYHKPADDQARYSQWAAQMFKALGDDAKYITYGILHLYGAGASYNTNYRGLAAYGKLIESIPNARHLRLICDEWRSRARENMTTHRRYDIGGLWKTKFSLLLMAFPKLDYPSTHSLFWVGGIGYYSDGTKWFQFPVHADGSAATKRAGDALDYASRIPNPSGKRLALGPYAAPMRMCNSVAKSHPLMLEHHADLGKMSSVKFYESRRTGRMPSQIEGGEDLEYLIATNDDRSSLSAIFVNTKRTPQPIQFRLQGDKQVSGEATVETYTCTPDKVWWTAPPGSISNQYDNGYLHDKTTTQPAGQPIVIPAFSVAKVVVPLAKPE